jgi:hypothetical protein
MVSHGIAPMLIAVAGFITWAVGVPLWIPLVMFAVAALGLMVAVVYPSALYRSWSYQLRPLELITRRGVIVKTERWLPRARVQYVDIVAGPISRALGLRQLVIYTAGSRLLTVGIPGIQADEAADLRADLLAWSRSEPAEDGLAREEWIDHG